MHVYEWTPREFKVVPPPISIPGSTNQWTHRMEPGISSYSSNPEVNASEGEEGGDGVSCAAYHVHGQQCLAGSGSIDTGLSNLL